MKIKNPLKLASIAALISPLAIFAGLHSLASVRAFSAPSDAVAVSPWHGVAQTNLAFSQFYENVESIGASSINDRGPARDSTEEALAKSLVAAANASVNEARRAIQLEPMSAKSLAIIAFSQPDPSAKIGIIQNASLLSKRELALQGLLLEHHILEKNYSGIIETIDQILRAHPQMSTRFFPILLEVLAVEETLPELAELFAVPLPWRQSFMNYAIRDDRVLSNLGSLRTQLKLDSQDFDRRLISRLHALGETDKARSVFNVVKANQRSPLINGKLDWAADYPPFEWRLASTPGLRSQIAAGGDGIEISVSPGRGGVVAARLINPPSPQSAIRLAHDIELSDELNNFKVGVICVPSKKVVFEGIVKQSVETFPLDDLPSSCEAYELVLSARAWTGAKPLRGTISTISFVPR